MKNIKTNRIAAIDIGSSSIRMTIAEKVNKKVNILDQLEQSVRLGKDSFYKGRLYRNTIDECVRILGNYKKLCDEYLVQKIRAVATTAVRESANVDIFIDNVRTKTNINIEILSPVKEIEYIYRALNKKMTKKNHKGEYYGIVEIGAGSVEITIFNHSCILYSTALPLGALKMKQIFTKGFRGEENFTNYITMMIEHELQNLKRDIPYKKVKKLYGIGSELNQIADLTNSQENKNDEEIFITQKNLEKLCKKL
ncbi:MAG: hypothetical protein MJB14_15560, partial [Spirochaetes bacterium]|nr:hypothetical protein [Spirochaetota bacterium]